ncbi:MAG: DNA mismatch repair protein MutS, partial [candidate division Zixibacteria bacterium]|nr:DNA mismatch repair protein MutS [candidate division Zixibacteria bacterium]
MSSSADGTLTPLMRQYNKIKSQYPDKILFFRMGDVYEMFGNDAIKAAPILNIALTSRGHLNGEKIPLAGIPHHAVDKYLARLLAAGEKVVIVEQVENPKLAKGIVKREVVEIITPGTATIDGVIGNTSSLYLACIVFDSSTHRSGIAYIDLLSGRFLLDEGSKEHILERIRVLSPQEIIYAQASENNEIIDTLKRYGGNQLTSFEDWNFDYKTAVRELSEFFGIASLEAFGVGDLKYGLICAGAILKYLKENNRTQLDHVTKLAAAESDDYMLLDYNTIRNLELIRSLAENAEKDS